MAKVLEQGQQHQQPVEREETAGGTRARPLCGAELDALQQRLGVRRSGQPAGHVLDQIGRLVRPVAAPGVLEVDDPGAVVYVRSRSTASPAAAAA